MLKLKQKKTYYTDTNQMHNYIKSYKMHSMADTVMWAGVSNISTAFTVLISCHIEMHVCGQVCHREHVITGQLWICCLLPPLCRLQGSQLMSSNAFIYPEPFHHSSSVFFLLLHFIIFQSLGILCRIVLLGEERIYMCEVRSESNIRFTYAYILLAELGS